LIAPLLLVLALVPNALAWSPSGLGVPVSGGALAGPTEPGALGLTHNPAAAHPDRSEWTLDMGLLGYRYSVQLEDEEAISSSGVIPVPFLAAAIPVGPLGVGLDLAVPYGRAGSGDADAATRFHTVEGSLRVYQVGLSAAWELNPWLTVGGAATWSSLEHSAVVKRDAGVMINEMAGEDLAPVGDPLLEGTQTVNSLGGSHMGWRAGLRAVGAEGEVFSASYRSSHPIDVLGDFSLQPSDDLALVLEGEAAGVMIIPPAITMGLRVPFRRHGLLLELGWEGWSSFEVITTDISNLTVGSPDPFLEGILAAYGLDDPATLGSSTNTAASGWRDVYTQGVALAWWLTEDLELRTGVWHATPAVPTDYVWPGNADWRSVDIRTAIRWRHGDWGDLGLGIDLIPHVPRVVEESILDAAERPPDVRALPSGVGRYGLQLARIGVTVVMHHF
jgi:long-subunit fatty acid transport protein